MTKKAKRKNIRKKKRSNATSVQITWNGMEKKGNLSKKRNALKNAKKQKNG